MKFISEEMSASLISHEMAYQAAREAFIAVGRDAVIFPAVLAHGSAPTNRMSIKSASTSTFAGLKVGSFWPSNAEQGLPRHNSLILMFDQDVGRIEWVIEAGKVNAYRTAAGDAVAADVLAREDSSILSVFGAGNQAFYECVALTSCTTFPPRSAPSRASARSSRSWWWRGTRRRGMPSSTCW